MKAVVIDRKSVNDRMGHIQIRITLNGVMSAAINEDVRVFA